MNQQGERRNQGSKLGKVGLDRRGVSAGSQVVLTAQPAAGSYFESWGGSLTGLTTNPITIFVNANVSAIAGFGQTVTVTLGSAGTGSGSAGWRTGSPEG